MYISVLEEALKAKLGELGFASDSGGIELLTGMSKLTRDLDAARKELADAAQRAGDAEKDARGPPDRPGVGRHCAGSKDCRDAAAH